MVTAVVLMCATLSVLQAVANAAPLRPDPVITGASLASGLQHSCGLLLDGSVDCWGSERNDQGQRVDQPAGDNPFTEVAAGDRLSCGIRRDATATCWGANDYGQGNAEPGAFTQLSVGRWHACGLRPAGSVECWGAENPDVDFGQAADRPAGAHPFVAIDAGDGHTCGVRSDGSIDCWGNNESGQAESQPSGAGFIQVAGGYRHTCGLTGDGTIDCWGRNLYGEASDHPVGGSSFTQIDAGGIFTCGLRKDGSVSCWGTADGDMTRDVPAQDNPFTEITAGWGYACGLRRNGEVLCWGYGSYDIYHSGRGYLPFGDYRPEFKDIAVTPGAAPSTFGEPRPVDVEVTDQAGYGLPGALVVSTAGGSATTDVRGIAHFEQTADVASYCVESDGVEGCDWRTGEIETRRIARDPDRVVELEFYPPYDDPGPWTAGELIETRFCASNAAGECVPGKNIDFELSRGYFTNSQGDPLGQRATLTSNGLGNSYPPPLSIGRDLGFDDDGRVQATLRITGAGLEQTLPLEWTSENPLPGGRVELSASPSQLHYTAESRLTATTWDRFGNRVGGETVWLRADRFTSISSRSVLTSYQDEPQAVATTERTGNDTVRADWDDSLSVVHDAVDISWLYDVRPAIEATLRGEDNGRRDDVLQVAASPIAAGSEVTLYRVITGTSDGASMRKAVGTKALGERGRRWFTVRDPNGRRRTEYIAEVHETNEVRGDMSNALRVR